MTVKQLLDDAKAITGSDRQTAIRLGIDAAFISKIRSGKQVMPTAKAFRLADILGRPHLHVVCEEEAEQVKDPKDRDMYLRLKSGFMASAGVLLLATTMYAARPIIDKATSARIDQYTALQDLPHMTDDGLFIAHLLLLLLAIAIRSNSAPRLSLVRLCRVVSRYSRDTPLLDVGKSAPTSGSSTLALRP